MNRVALAALVLTLPGLWACNHDRLDFSVPVSSNDAAVGCDDAGHCTAEAVDGSMRAGPSARNSDAGAPDAAGRGRGTPGLHFHQDPDGYPTTPSHRAPWCDQMKSFEELCDTDIDEDCDGRVDEFPGLGGQCFNGCYEGVYVCDPKTNSLLCQGPAGCTNQLPPSCGDGIAGYDEECDPNAPGERSGITCTVDCRRPLFVLCTTSGTPEPDVCDAMHKCDERIGACVPVIGPGQPRCPKIAIEGATAGEFYPMLETEESECLITCSKPAECPGILSECYMGFCAAPF